MKKIKDQTKIKGVTLKNRLIRSATWEGMADEAGGVTDELLTLYTDLAEGGVGAIITSVAHICKEGMFLPGMLGAYSDAFKDGFCALSKAAHACGTPIFMQIGYGGLNMGKDQNGQTIYAASALTHPVTGVVGTEATKKDLAFLTDCFVKTARRAKDWGFDGVQVHCAHDYFLNEFLNRRFNQRTDEYGGSLENRARLLTEIIKGIRQETGDDFIIGMKINSVDNYEDGLTLPESVEICKIAEQSGMDFIEVSGGSKSAKPELSAIRPDVGRGQKEGYYMMEAEVISNAVQIPVISVGGYRSKTVIEQALNTGNIEYISMSRPFICESDIPKRLIAGQEKSACISCRRCNFYKNNICILNQKKHG